MKQVFKQAVAGVIGVSLAAAFSARAQSVTVTDISNWSGVEVVNLDLTYPSLGGGYNGGVYAGINTLQVMDGSQTVTATGFCIDPYHWSASVSSDSIVSLADAPKTPGPMSAAAALEVEDLWGEYYNSALTDPTVAGPLQLAIWEVVSASIDNGNYVSLDAGQSGAGQIGALATQYIATAANYTGPVPDLVALTTGASPGQDYVIANYSGSGVTPNDDPVPDGGNTAMFLALALCGLAALPRMSLVFSFAGAASAAPGKAFSRALAPLPLLRVTNRRF